MQKIETNIIHAHSREMLELHIILVSANTLMSFDVEKKIN